MSEKPRKPLAELLRELDAELERDPMPAGARNRIELRIRAHERPHAGRWRKWLPACTFAAGAALVLAVIGLRVPEEEARVVQTDGRPELATSDAAAEPLPELGVFALAGDECESRPAGTASEMRGDCRLVAEHMTVEVWETAVLEAEESSLRLHSGRALFDVAPVRSSDTPVRIEVSHGAIEVVGTRFAVAQDGDGGHVDLFEGKIRFHAEDGTVVDIRPGQRHGWGSEKVAIDDRNEDTIEILPDVESEAKRRPMAMERDDIISRVEKLRAEQRYRAAISVLRDANRKRWDRRTAQSLSYELGELLRLRGDRDAACEHLHAHQRRFPDGLYDDAIERWLDKLDCE